MEQVLQVQVHVAAAKLGDSRTLFDDLEAHRRDLRGLRGFVSMSINRSIESGGDTAVSVDTRWNDQGALEQYLGSARTVESIIRENAAITVPDTLSVRQMEGLDSARPTKQAILFERFSLALMVPLAIVGIGFAIIYALSRVYLEFGAGGASTTLAIVVAGGIVLVAWYFAENKAAPAWHYAAVGGAVVALLVGGTVWAQVSEGPEHHSLIETEHEGGEEPAPTDGPLVILLQDNEVHTSRGGGANPTIEVASGAEIQVINEGNALHNLHVSPFEASICSTDGPSPCTDPARINGGDEGTIVFDIPPGTYEYRCDFHTAEMHGTLKVGPQEPAGGETPAAGGETPTSDETAADAEATPAP
jgi:hypothetical protein